MLADMKIVQWQIITWLSIVRLICNLLLIVLWTTTGPNRGFSPSELPVVLSDIFLLTWDVITRGAWCATVLWQSAIDIYQIFGLIYDGSHAAKSLAIGGAAYAQYAPWAIVTFCLLYAFTIILNAVMLFMKLGSGGYMRLGQGVKDIGRSVPAPKISIKGIFGSRRSDNDDVTWGSIYCSFGRFIKCYSIVIFTRGTDYGQPLMQAIPRNATSIFLLSALIGQSIILTYNLFVGDVSVRSYLSEAVYPPFNLSEVSLLFLGSSFAPSAYNITLLYNQQAAISASAQCPVFLPLSCQAYLGRPINVNPPINQTICFPTMNTTGCSENPTGLNIEIQIDTTSVISDMGRLWLLPWKVTLDEIQDLDVVPILQSTQGTQLQPGQHLDGLVGFSRRRVLARTVSGLLGFPARYIDYSQLPIAWLPDSVKSINATIASATLTLERLPLEYHIYSSGNPSNGPLYEVVEDYRPQTMLGVLTGIGGLLAALQGLHTLLFGLPLFWGLFGSKSLNPFGRVGRVGRGQSEKMRKLYGQIPPLCERSHTLPLAERLAFFICDFLLDTGPLAEADSELPEKLCELEEEVVCHISNH